MARHKYHCVYSQTRSRKGDGWRWSVMCESEEVSRGWTLSKRQAKEQASDAFHAAVLADRGVLPTLEGWRRIREIVFLQQTSGVSNPGAALTHLHEAIMAAGRYPPLVDMVDTDTIADGSVKDVEPCVSREGCNDEQA